MFAMTVLGRESLKDKEGRGRLLNHDKAYRKFLHPLIRQRQEAHMILRDIYIHKRYIQKRYIQKRYILKGPLKLF